MAFDSFAAFLQMGKHGFYVWLSYGVGLGSLILLWWHCCYSRRKIVAGIKEFEARRQRRKTSKTTERVL
ncbi:heme exporter protein CcmD [Neiella sp. HB171785]|uniref:Heme exporter protein D n=1 Tax=Neiella litorisoli TaxID=2771431 RepID=A0A8J6QKP4_9GAMM|nr:heme exporter protein CcmD [Neiella litorisoli]MBD1389832.1 heme exporter protein CcmD [Neiella litorisoli]